MTTTTDSIGRLAVPPLALGTMFFGTTVPEDAALACLDTAADLGATFWDTANNYAFWAGGTGDESETLIGRWLTDHGPAVRDDITLATKVGARPLPGYADLDHTAGLGAHAVREQITDSLRRLRTDHVDLLYAHVDDARVPLEETLGVFGSLVDEGLVREVAASNLTAERLASALATPAAHPYRALQQRFTYLPVAEDADTGVQVALDDATHDVAGDAGVRLVGYSPLLSGAYTRRDVELPEEYRTSANARRLELLRDAATDVGLDAGQLVLAWMRQRPAPVHPLVGVSRPEQVRSAWEAVRTALPEQTVTALEEARH